MTVRRVALALVALAGCSAPCASAVIEMLPEGSVPRCAVEIEFRTRRGEVEFDGVTLGRVLRFVETTKAIKHAYDRRIGYSDPPVLCLVIEITTEALAVFEQLTNIVPVPRIRLPRMRPAPPVVLRYTGD